MKISVIVFIAFFALIEKIDASSEKTALRNCSDKCAALHFAKNSLKTTASICFVLSAVFALNSTSSSGFGLLILTGLVLGLVGDILLDLKIMYTEQSQEYFFAGTISFALGHFFYFMACLLFGKITLPTNILWNILISVGVSAILTLAIMLSSKKMGLNFGKSLSIVIVYSVILTFMVAFSVSIAIFAPVFWIVAIGMILFFLSDLVLSMQYFGNKGQKVWIWINHILYYLAQILLALSILFLI